LALTIQKKEEKICAIFCASDEGSYTTYDNYIIDHDWLNHGYNTFGYLNNDIATMSMAAHRQQFQSTTSVSSVASTILPL
jgi:hypothetical protein